ncbi:MAG: Mur ligase family protein [Candidatus Shapirobacteria bacterium]|nr:Mur ligase family protein [Candidatus Shapirobacteria bacterium]
MKKTNLKKLLYLLQLEEYQTSRYFVWLKKNKIESLEERKNKLKFTSRIILTIISSCLLSPLLGFKKAVGVANSILAHVFLFLGKIIIFLAKIKLKFFPNLIKIVITGSYGKTTFKEMLAWVLEEKYLVLKTPGNINTQLGIAWFLLKKLNKKHQVLIVEAGAYQRGDIKQIGNLIKPNYGIITIIGWMHLERFGTIDSIRKTKFEIGDFITPATNLFIKDKNNFFYPLKDHQFIDFEKTILEIAKNLAISSLKVKKRLKTFATPEYRLTIRNINKNLIILEDVYNSNPLGFSRALKKLGGYRGYQKIVVTPGMIELGEKQFSLNEKAAYDSAKTADILVIVGQTNKESLIKGAQKAGKKNLRIIIIDKNDNFEEKIRSFLRPPTVILLENDLPDHYF